MTAAAAAGDAPAPAPARGVTPRTLGVLGGMSWESTAVYYRLVNQGVAARLGGLHSARILLHSIDFAPLVALQAASDWAGAAALLADAAAGLRRAGAQAMLLATNTMHKVAPAIEAGSGLPLLHIADATGGALAVAGVRRAALLGTRYTMEDPSILREPLARQHAVQAVVPDDADRALVHRVIFDELCRGTVDAASRRALGGVIERLRARGAEAVILGCTELTMLIGADDSPLPVFDTTLLHAAAAVEWLLATDGFDGRSQGGDGNHDRGQGSGRGCGADGNSTGGRNDNDHHEHAR